MTRKIASAWIMASLTASAPQAVVMAIVLTAIWFGVR